MRWDLHNVVVLSLLYVAGVLGFVAPVALFAQEEILEEFSETLPAEVIEESLLLHVVLLVLFSFIVVGLFYWVQHRQKREE